MPRRWRGSVAGEPERPYAGETAVQQLESRHRRTRCRQRRTCEYRQNGKLQLTPSQNFVSVLGPNDSFNILRKHDDFHVAELSVYMTLV